MAVFHLKFMIKLNNFNFEIINFLYLNGDYPRSPSYGVYISQLICLREYVLMLMTSTTEAKF